MHCSVIEHGYDVIEFSHCSTEKTRHKLSSFVQFKNEMVS